MKLCIAALAALLAASSAPAAERTEAVSGESNALTEAYSLGEPKSRPGGLVELYQASLDRIAPPIILDRFGPDSELGWTRARLHDGYAYVGEWNATGRNAVGKTLLSGLHETAVGLPGIEERNTLAANLLEGTVGDTLESQVDPAAPTMNASEVSWESQTRREGWLLYGMRPIDTRPYAYESMVIRIHGRVLGYENIRIRYTLLQKLHLEGTVIIVLTRSWQVNAGFENDLMRFDGDRAEQSFSIGLNKVFSPARKFGMGVSMDRGGHGFAIAKFSQSF